MSWKSYNCGHWKSSGFQRLWGWPCEERTWRHLGKWRHCKGYYNSRCMPCLSKPKQCTTPTVIATVKYGLGVIMMCQSITTNTDVKEDICVREQRHKEKCLCFLFKMIILIYMKFHISYFPWYILKRKGILPSPSSLSLVPFILPELLG